MHLQALEDYQPFVVLVMLVGTTLLETARPFAGIRDSAVAPCAAQSRHRPARIRRVRRDRISQGGRGGMGRRTPRRAPQPFSMPWPVRIAASLLACDLIDYLFHRLQHGLPLMWRFHRIHHSDPRLDASTSLRFHPVEGVAQTAFQAVAIVVFGIRLDAVALFDTLLLMLLYVQHANIAWPERVDRVLRLALVTPDVHHVHHSREQRYTDSNFADVFTLWDRVLGTYAEAPDRRAIAYGLAEFDADAHQTVKGMTLMPLAPVGPAAAEWRDAARTAETAR